MYEKIRRLGFMLPIYVRLETAVLKYFSQETIRAGDTTYPPTNCFLPLSDRRIRPLIKVPLDRSFTVALHRV